MEKVTLMTYARWEEIHKKRVKRKLKKILCNLLAIAMVYGFFAWMFISYLMQEV